MSVVIVLSLGTMWTIYMLFQPTLRLEENLFSRINNASYISGNENVFNRYKQKETLEVDLWKRLTDKEYEKYCILKYTDLSRDLRKRITKEAFESISSYEKAQEVFNYAFQGDLSMFEGELEGTLFTPLLMEEKNKAKRYLEKDITVIGEDAEEHRLKNVIFIDYEYGVKPVITGWYVRGEL